MSKVLHKLHFNGEPIYVDLTAITVIARYSDMPGYLAAALPTPTHKPPQTTITVGAIQYYIDEHISEILAAIEGRDSLPSKVLFGRTKK